MGDPVYPFGQGFFLIPASILSRAKMYETGSVGRRPTRTHGGPVHEGLECATAPRGAIRVGSAPTADRLKLTARSAFRRISGWNPA
jgi:hypothetical protein